MRHVLGAAVQRPAAGVHGRGRQRGDDPARRGRVQDVRG